jgi:hypothetical protein
MTPATSRSSASSQGDAAPPTNNGNITIWATSAAIARIRAALTLAGVTARFSFGSSQLGVRGVRSPPEGDARTTGSRETGGGGGGGAALVLMEESFEGPPDVQSRSTTRGDGWCLGTVIAMRAGMEGLCTKTHE